jgi:hypothetical protein
LDAFEHVVAEILWAKGYWVRTSFAINLTKEQKAAVGNPSMPRPEIDIVAYHAASNHLLAVECKSFLNSTGVTYAELCGDKSGDRYKLFRRPALRELVLRELVLQCEAMGLSRPGATVQLGMVAGKVRGNDEAALASLFEAEGWFFHGPQWVRTELSKQASTAYTNQIATVVAKILLAQ